MAKAKKVSSKTHSQKQLDDYANQHNPNNKAYKARIANDRMNKKASSKHSGKQVAKKWAKLETEVGVMYPLDWMCYSNPYDYD